MRSKMPCILDERRKKERRRCLLHPRPSPAPHFPHNAYLGPVERGTLGAEAVVKVVQLVEPGACGAPWHGGEKLTTTGSCGSERYSSPPPALPGLAHVAAAVQPLQCVAFLAAFFAGLAVGNGLVRLHGGAVGHADGGRLNAEAVRTLLQLLERVKARLPKPFAVDVLLVQRRLAGREGGREGGRVWCERGGPADGERRAPARAALRT